MYFFFADEVGRDPHGAGAGFLSQNSAMNNGSEMESTFTLGADDIHSHALDQNPASFRSRILFSLRTLIALSTTSHSPGSAHYSHTMPVMKPQDILHSSEFSLRLFLKLPTEIRVRIVACLDSRTYHAVKRTPVIAPIMRSLYDANRRHICSLAIQLQFPVEHSHPVMQYLTEVTESSEGVPQLVKDVHDSRYRALLELIHGATELAATAIQWGMRTMRTRALIKHQLLYVFGLLPHIDDRHYVLARNLDRAEMFWTIFAKMSAREIKELMNFLDNIWHAFLVANPINFKSRVVLCRHTPIVKCAWAITDRFTDELLQLGIFEIIAKQRILALLAAIFFSYMSMDHCNRTTAQQLELIAIMRIFHQQIWNPEVLNCAAETGPGTRRFRSELRLATEVDYTISVYGDRGDGWIDLQLEPSIDILRWLMMALQAGDGPMPTWDDIPADGRGLLAGSILRRPYWSCWEWYGSWGLEKLFKEEPPAQKVVRPRAKRRIFVDEVDQLERLFYKLSLE